MHVFAKHNYKSFDAKHTMSDLKVIGTWAL
jgi:hypothetical protein